MKSDTRNILLFGAGKSATVLINYLLARSALCKWTLTVVDADLQLARSKINAHPYAVALSFDITNTEERVKVISHTDIVISMLPPALHYIVAQDCITFRKNLLTASYLDEKIKALQSEINRHQLLFLCEMGLDPGIDHMSAMQMIDHIKDQGGLIKSFKSHCGGLLAPESDDNPWHYKITWNPANIVNAGKAGAVYKENGRIIKINYPDIFDQHGTVSIPGYGPYACYPNRDSLPYMSLYRLESISTFIRTTLRHPHFCTGWKYVIKAGLTNEDPAVSAKNYTGKPIAEWFLHCLRIHTQSGSFTDFLTNQVAAEERILVQELFSYLGLLSNEIIPGALSAHSSVLQYLLESRLKLSLQDKDMIVMLHEIDYEVEGKDYEAKSSMTIKGEDHLITAMAKTVGLPLAIAAELILNNSIRLTGLHIPVIKDIYEPVLAKLKDNKIYFREI
ncbi:MAG TPA: saccharopine dehydrogenase C-terminal domain-containing protein [Niabella sp.]|nr:saccharopine dehydrogenase C-terminal domain-containing protein [Niabella sp.]